MPPKARVPTSEPVLVFYEALKHVTVGGPHGVWKPMGTRIAPDELSHLTEDQIEMLVGMNVYKRIYDTDLQAEAALAEQEAAPANEAIAPAEEVIERQEE